MKYPLSLEMEILRIGIFLCLAPFFGAIFKDLSHDFEEGVKAGSKWKIWTTMTVYIVGVTLMTGWLQPFSWRSFGTLVLSAPLLGYLAMLGATKIKRPRFLQFGDKSGKR